MGETKNFKKKQKIKKYILKTKKYQKKKKKKKKKMGVTNNFTQKVLLWE